MLAVPASLSQAFEALLNQRNILDQQRRDFHKWLRYYLDFCSKHDSNPILTTQILSLMSAYWKRHDNTTLQPNFRSLS